MTNDDISRIAVEHGFTLRPQGDGSLDLNPYVYRFAEALIEAQAAKDTALLRQALEVLEDDDGKLWPSYKRNAAIDAIRTRLEETK